MTAGLSQTSIVIPTIGRPSLRVLLTSIIDSAERTGLPVPPIVVADDRRSDDHSPLFVGGPDDSGLTVVRSHGRGPAAARNAGWRLVACRRRPEWIVFLDDDVVVGPMWLRQLDSDLRAASVSIGGVQGRITVPLPTERPPRDWERGTAGLASAHWITADMAYRLSALEACQGFDERFPRAFREDADLALRVQDAGFELTFGTRHTTHPVRSAPWWASVAQQRGNADDVLMRRLHGRGWRRRAHAPLGRRPLHLATAAFGLAAVAAAGLSRGRTAFIFTARVAAAAWALLTADFAWRRIRPGPGDPREVRTMIATSIAIPFAASWHYLVALLRPSTGVPQTPRPMPAAVLLDRDGTIVKDVPYNGDPAAVEPMPGARAALDRLRAAGIPLAVISNQSGVGRGLISPEAVRRVNERIDELLGPFEGWFVCPHVDADGCECRKPKAGLVLEAARGLGVRAEQCVVIGDVGADMGCAAAAGARGVLVPTAATRLEEIAAAGSCRPTLEAAVDLVLSGSGGP